LVHSLGFSVERSGFEFRPKHSESMKLFLTYKLIPVTQISTNVDSLEVHLKDSGYQREYPLRRSVMFQIETDGV
jgi:hypothetical protein